MNENRDEEFIAEALPAFMSEADEQLVRIEQLLLELEAAPDDRDRLDALFRCAHTIKGSAGVFGLDAVVTFTHHIETLLDQVREGRVAMTPALSTLLLTSNDRIRVLIAMSATPAAARAHLDPAQVALVAQLQQACETSGDAGAGAPAVAVEAAGGQTRGDAADDEACRTGTAVAADTGMQRWQVSVGFGIDTFRNGLDPLAILEYLRELGTVSMPHCVVDTIPTLEAIDPEACHLGLDFAIDTAAGRAGIEHAFDFVRPQATLRIEAPVDAAAHGEGVEAGDQPADAARDVAAARDAVATSLKQALVAAGAPAAGAGGSAAHPATEDRFIRVHADRLDAVINLLGELVIAGAGATTLARQSRQRGLIEANMHTARLIEQIRNGTLQLRMVPIGETFARFRRVVRDTASALGKDVALEIVGGDTELDKSMVERIADPLMHLVRNALDHGLEPAAQRTAAGKPARGRLLLSACHESGAVLIRIEDDGRGIQRDKVLKRAWERGLLAQGEVPPDDEILALIFAPGFSTAETVTNLSGRGVGMDVVRRNIEELRGTVSIASVPGRGASIEIRLPLTLAIIDGFLVGVGASKFIFPLESVVEVIETGHTETVPDARGRSCVSLRGALLPVVDLRTLYALEGEQPARGSVVVIRSGSGRYGVMVDTLLGQHQTVIKPLGRMLRSLRGVSGSSILGSGEVALIIDVGPLGQLLAQPPASSARSSRPTGETGPSTRTLTAGSIA